ncbi:MAG TPA: sulfite exporter TauE/SafE family protein [Longimicrobiaceae bacterium]
MSVLVYLVIGLGAGVLSGLFGVGGGVLIVPALILFVGLSTHAAVGTSLGALLLPVGILGAIAYYRSGNLDLQASLLIAVGLFIGAHFGARIALSLSPVNLTRAFAVFLVLVAVRMWVGTLGR